MFELLAVLGVDDGLIAIGLGVAAGFFRARQAKVKADFLQQHGDQIEAENERIANDWRASKPRKKRLLVDREFKPPVLLAPTVRVKQKFKRDPRPWYRKLF